jgi:hypothetical protein
VLPEYMLIFLFESAVTNSGIWPPFSESTSHNDTILRIRINTRSTDKAKWKNTKAKYRTQRRHTINRSGKPRLWIDAISRADGIGGRQQAAGRRGGRARGGERKRPAADVLLWYS